MFHLFTLASAWGKTVDFNILFVILTRQDAVVSSLHLAYDPLTFILFINEEKSYNSHESVQKAISDPNRICYDNQ